MKFMQKSARGVNNEASRAMKAQYRQWCKCGVFIQVGDVIYFEKSRRAVCHACGRKSQQNLVGDVVLVSPTPPLQKIIDRLRQIQSLPRDPLPEELQEIVRDINELAQSLCK